MNEVMENSLIGVKTWRFEHFFYSFVPQGTSKHLAGSQTLRRYYDLDDPEGYVGNTPKGLNLNATHRVSDRIWDSAPHFNVKVPVNEGVSYHEDIFIPGDPVYG